MTIGLVPCPDCEGQGSLVIVTGAYQREEICPTCEGSTEIVVLSKPALDRLVSLLWVSWRTA